MTPTQTYTSAHPPHFQCLSKSNNDKPSSLRYIRDLLRLYCTGVYELIRQLVFATRHPILTSTTYKTCLNELQQQNLIVIITGGTSGIGRSLLQLLRKVAFHVILLAHPQCQLSTVVDHQIPIDFANRHSTESAATALLQHLTTLPKNPVALFHCAAVCNPHEKSLHHAEFSTAAETTFQINTVMPTLFLHRVRAVVDVTVLIASSAQYCAPAFDGAVCPICSTSTPYAAYPTSKLIVLANTHEWACTWGKRVIAIHPGIVDTSLYDNERGIMGTLVRTVVRNLAWTPHQSAVRILYVLCLTQVLNTIGQRSTTQDDGQGSSSSLPLYWDTVAMRPAALPKQIERSSDRSTTAQWTYAHLDLDVRCITQYQSQILRTSQFDTSHNEYKSKQK